MGVPAGSLLQATDFAASLKRALSGELGRFRIVHFATHGLLNTEHPELSGLVFSLFDQRGKPQDGFLRLNEIYNHRLPADLVVLSACQTALGQEVRGEGLVGLTRGYMYAGARRVVASLWRVDDLATAAVLGRLAFATPAGALIGINRDLHGKPAGLRTHPLVGLGASLITIVASELGGSGDPASVARVIQGIITGIGFLGAGVILHSRDDQTVYGLTTAATIWIVACLGVACGAGTWKLALAGLALVFVVLVLGRTFERVLHRWLGPRPVEHGATERAAK